MRRICVVRVGGRVVRRCGIFDLHHGTVGQIGFKLLVSALENGAENFLVRIFDVSFQRARITISSTAVRHATFVRFLVLVREHMARPRRNGESKVKAEVSLILQMIEPFESFVTRRTFVFPVLAVR